MGKYYLYPNGRGLNIYCGFFFSKQLCLEFFMSKKLKIGNVRYVICKILKLQIYEKYKVY